MNPNVYNLIFPSIISCVFFFFFFFLFATDVQTLDSIQALCLPLGASVSLLVMFFFFDSMQLLFAVCTASKSLWRKLLSTFRWTAFISVVFIRLFDSHRYSCPGLFAVAHVPILESSLFVGKQVSRPSVVFSREPSKSDLFFFFFVLMMSICRISFGICGRFTGAELMSFSLAVTIVCVWILTGHWLLMDGNRLLAYLAYLSFSNSGLRVSFSCFSLI